MDQNHRATLLREHYATLQSFWESVLEHTGYCAILLGAGHQRFFFHDDQGPPFRPNPLMVQWLAQEKISENSWFIFAKDTDPILFFHQPDDFWHAATPAPEFLWDHLSLRVFRIWERCTPRFRIVSSNAKAARGKSHKLVRTPRLHPRVVSSTLLPSFMHCIFSAPAKLSMS